MYGFYGVILDRRLHFEDIFKNGFQRKGEMGILSSIKSNGHLRNWLLVKMFEKIKTMLFDLDGTLLDSKYAFCLQIYDYFKKNGLRPPSYFEVISRIPKVSLREFLLSLLPSNLQNPTFVDIAVRELDYSYTHFYLPKFAREVPGSIDFIHKLKAKGVRVGLVTNGTRAMLNTYLRSFDVDIDIALSADDVAPKPNPKGILRALTILSVDPEKVLFCGDSITDITAGINAGTRTVGVLSGVGTKADLERAGADFFEKHLFLEPHSL